MSRHINRTRTEFSSTTRWSTRIFD